MKYRKFIAYFLMLSSVVFIPYGYAASDNSHGFLYNFFVPRPDNRPWSVMGYFGRTAEQQLGHVMFEGQFASAGESVISAELARTLYKTWWFKLQFAGNFAVRIADKCRYHDSYPIAEGDIYFMGRATTFPWSDYIDTTVAVGEGLSLASRPPFPEEGVTADDSKSYLNFMAFEITLGLPSHREWELVFRLHHRCAAWGTFAPGDYHAGSNNVGIGIRYFF